MCPTSLLLTLLFLYSQQSSTEEPLLENKSTIEIIYLPCQRLPVKFRELYFHTVGLHLLRLSFLLLATFAKVMFLKRIGRYGHHLLCFSLPRCSFKTHGNVLPLFPVCDLFLIRIPHKSSTSSTMQFKISHMSRAYQA